MQQQPADRFSTPRSRSSGSLGACYTAPRAEAAWKLCVLALSDNVHAMAQPLLVRAAQSANTAEVRRLVAGGADVDAKGYGGMTALLWAAIYGNSEMARVLLEAGVDVEAKSEEGQTPLHRAVAKGDEGTVWEILNAGADVASKDSEGATPLHYAARQGGERLLNFITPFLSDPISPKDD